ncbi:MAG: sulfotransferase family protein [Pseudomonadota bacterium]
MTYRETPLDPDFRQWLPIRIYLAEGQWRVDWCWFGDSALDQPFYRDSVQQAMRLPFNQAMRLDTPIAALLDWQRISPGLAPRVFIQHASRCGSTLFAQLLASLDRHIVLSEPPPLDSLLRAHLFDNAAAAQQAAWVRALLSAFGQRRRGMEEALVIKLDAWNIFEADFLYRLYPATPWLFLYRDPVEIVVSQLRQPGVHMVPGMLGPSLLAFTAQESLQMSRLEFTARSIGRILQQGLECCLRNGGIAANYQELPGAVWGRLGPLLGLRETDLPGLQETAAFDAKQPGMQFEPDSRLKRESASSEVREAVERWAAEPYQALERLRLSTAAPCKA